jgi:hypothetical protein
VPVNVAVEALTGAEIDADKTTLCGVPGVRVKLAGVADTPAAKPLSCTETWEENPLTPAADIETDVPEPGETIAVVGEAARVKSGEEGGGGVDC